VLNIIIGNILCPVICFGRHLFAGSTDLVSDA